MKCVSFAYTSVFLFHTYYYLLSRGLGLASIAKWKEHLTTYLLYKPSTMGSPFHSAWQRGVIQAFLFMLLIHREKRRQKLKQKLSFYSSVLKKEMSKVPSYKWEMEIHGKLQSSPQNIAPTCRHWQYFLIGKSSTIMNIEILFGIVYLPFLFSSLFEYIPCYRRGNVTHRS